MAAVAVRSTHRGYKYPLPTETAWAHFDFDATHNDGDGLCIVSYEHSNVLNVGKGCGVQF